MFVTMESLRITGTTRCVSPKTEQIDSSDMWCAIAASRFAMSIFRTVDRSEIGLVIDPELSAVTNVTPPRWGRFATDDSSAETTASRTAVRRG